MLESRAMSELPSEQNIPRSQRRQSRYIRAQERRDAQRRADQRFYNAIFGVIGACVMVVLGLAMFGTIQGDGSGEAAADRPEVVVSTFLGLTGLQWAGMAVVAVIAFFMWRRISKR